MQESKVKRRARQKQVQLDLLQERALYNSYVQDTVDRRLKAKQDHITLNLKNKQLKQM